MSLIFHGLRIVLLLGSVSLVAACGADAPTAPAPAAAVSVRPASLVMKIGDTATVTASVTDAKGVALPNRGVTWSIADQTVAQVTALGVLTALASGQTTITATSEGKTATASVSVLSPPAVTIQTNLPKIFVGDTAIIVWTTQNATSCTRSGSWTGTSTTGAQLAYVPSEGGVKTFSLSCTGPGGTTTSSTTLIVPLPVYSTSYENAKIYTPLQVQPIPRDPNPVGIPCVADEGVAYHDFFQDGTLSLFVNGADGVNPGKMCFWRRTAQGTWQNATSEILQDQRGCILARKILVVDFNRDKRPDLYLTCTGYDHPPYPAERTILLMSTASGKYNRIEMPDVAYTHGGSSADLNGDGYPDLLFLDSNQRKYWVLLNDRGTGTFTRDDTRLPTAFLANRPWYTAELMDIDLDGSVDLFISGFNSDDPISGAPAAVLWGDRSGRFNQRPPVILPRVDGCYTPIDVLLYAGRLYLLRECNVYKGSAVQRVNVSDLSSAVVWEARDGPNVWFWIFPLEGKLLLEHRQVFLKIDP